MVCLPMVKLKAPQDIQKEISPAHKLGQMRICIYRNSDVEFSSLNGDFSFESKPEKNLGPRSRRKEGLVTCCLQILMY